MLSRRHLLAAAASVLAVPPEAEARPKGGVSGRVLTPEGRPVPGARITLFTVDRSLVLETHTDRQGRYRFARVGDGLYHLDVAARGFQYREIIVSVSGRRAQFDFTLLPESALGEWNVVGNLDPAMTSGSLSGTLLPTGKVLLTNDGIHSLLYDAVTGEFSYPAAAGSPQAGHTPALLPDGRVLLIGGGPQDPDGTITPSALVRVYSAAEDTWEEWPSLLEARYGAGVVQLPDGKLLILGGRGVDGALLSSCELLDPEVGETVAAAPLPAAYGFTPAVPLPTGQALCTWEVPRVYDPARDEWRPVAPFLQPDRADLEPCPTGHTPPPGEAPHTGDLPDHLLAMLADGRVAAVGVRRTANAVDLSAAELYSLRSDGWAPGGSPRTVRSQPQVLPLPDGRLLVAGGREEAPDTAEDPDAWCQVPRTDLFDPESMSWRRVADMSSARGFRGVSVLLPDGRVLTAGGSGQPLLEAPSDGTGTVEVFTPPAFFRGVRPVIDSLSTATLLRGKTFSVGVSQAQAVTDLVLISAGARTRWSDGGTQRVLRLHFRQRGAVLRASLPKSSRELPAGLYLLFALDGDIPSEGRLVTVF